MSEKTSTAKVEKKPENIETVGELTSTVNIEDNVSKQLEDMRRYMAVKTSDTGIEIDSDFVRDLAYMLLLYSKKVREKNKALVPLHEAMSLYEYGILDRRIVDYVVEKIHSPRFNVHYSGRTYSFYDAITYMTLYLLVNEYADKYIDLMSRTIMDTRIGDKTLRELVEEYAEEKYAELDEDVKSKISLDEYKRRVVEGARRKIVSMLEQDMNALRTSITKYKLYSAFCASRYGTIPIPKAGEVEGTDWHQLSSPTRYLVQLLPAYCVAIISAGYGLSRPQKGSLSAVERNKDELEGKIAEEVGKEGRSGIEMLRESGVDERIVGALDRAVEKVLSDDKLFQNIMGELEKSIPVISRIRRIPYIVPRLVAKIKSEDTVWELSKRIQGIAERIASEAVRNGAKRKTYTADVLRDVVEMKKKIEDMYKEISAIQTQIEDARISGDKKMEEELVAKQEEAVKRLESLLGEIREKDITASQLVEAALIAHSSEANIYRTWMKLRTGSLSEDERESLGSTIATIRYIRKQYYKACLYTEIRRVLEEEGVKHVDFYTLDIVVDNMADKLADAEMQVVTARLDAVAKAEYVAEKIRRANTISVAGQLAELTSPTFENEVEASKYALPVTEAVATRLYKLLVVDTAKKEMEKVKEEISKIASVETAEVAGEARGKEKAAVLH